MSVRACYRRCATSCDEKYHDTDHQRHVSHVEDTGPKRPQADIKEVRHAAVPSYSVDQVAKAPSGEEGQPSNLPSTNAACQETPLAGEPNLACRLPT